MDGLIAARATVLPPGAAAEPPGASGALSPAGLLAGLRRSLLPICVCAVAGASLAYFYAASLPKSYTASAALAVEGDRMAIPELQGALRPDVTPDPMPLVHTEVQALSSRQLIQSVSDQLHMERDPEFNAALRPRGAFGHARDWLKSWLPVSSGGARQGAAAASVINAVTHGLVITQDNRSLVIGIDFTAHDPALAARFVNTLVKTYIEGRAERRVSANSGANAVMSQRIEQVRRDVEKIEQQMRDLRNSSGLVGLRAGSVGQQQVEDLANAASRATLDRSEIEANWERASALASGGSSDALASVLGSETISRLREQEALASAKVADLSQRYGPAYPALRSAQADLSATRAQLGGETHRIVASLATQLRVARAHEADVLAQLAAARSAGVAAQNTQAQLDQLAQDAATRRQLYRTLLERAQQTATQPQGTETPDVRVLSDAVPPGLPSSPNMKAAAGLGGIGGGLLAWGLSLAFLSQMQPRDGEAFARDLGIPVGARIAGGGRRQDMADRLGKSGAGQEADAMRALRGELARISRNAPRTIAFVAASAAGSTSAAAASCAYARAAAWDGQRVLLVDANAASGDLPRLLRMPQGRLASVLSGAEDMRDAVSPDRVSGLDCLVHAVKPAVSAADPARNAVGFENLLVEARDEYGLVVLAGPAAGTADAAALLRSSDAAVLVVDAKIAGDASAFAASRQLCSASRTPVASLLLGAG